MEIIKRINNKIMTLLYNVMWKLLRKNEMTSTLLRSLRLRIHNVDIGMYSYGCFDPLRFGKNAVIGRYCSFASTCYRFNGNHGISFIALHPYLYNTRLGLVKKESITRTKIVIEDDVWIGHNAIIVPGVDYIGRGSVIAAGAVVTRNVPRYAIVAGNPAKVIKFRFCENVINEIEATEWWNMNKIEIAALIKSNPKLCFNPVDFFSKEASK